VRLMGDLKDSADKFLHRHAYINTLKPKGGKWKEFLATNFSSKNLSQSVVDVIKFLTLRYPKKTSGRILFVSYSASRVEGLGLSYNRFVYPFTVSNPDCELISIEDGYIKNGLDKNNLKEYNLSIIVFLVRFFIIITKFLGELLRKRTPRHDSIILKRYGAQVSAYHLLYKLLIKKVNPSLIVTINWYGARGLGLNLAAHRAKVPLVDVQHGLAAESKHRAYLDLQSLDSELRPDFFLSWSSKDAELLNDQYESCVAYDVGNASLMVPPELQVAGVGLESEEDSILVILGISIPDWITRIINFALASHLRLVIRPHPSFPIDELVIKGLGQNVEVRDGGALATCFDKSMIAAIGEWSAGLLDAVASGIPAFSIGPEGQRDFKSQEGIESYDNIDSFLAVWDSPDSLKSVKRRTRPYDYLKAGEVVRQILRSQSDNSLNQ